jgi:predicted site-specific integrase-resolvase
MNKRLIIPLREAAAMLSVCRQTLMEYVKNGYLPCIKMYKNSIYFRLSDLDDFIDSREVRYAPLNVPAGNDLQ